MSCAFGNKLKEIREQSGFKQFEVAKALNLNKATVCKWERGRLEPNLDDLKKLAAFLDVSADELLDY
jgi:transcriptional regulator with XRE-family HTH domain